MTDTANNIGAAIHAARTRLKLSFRALGKLAGVPHVQIHRIESGAVKSPSIATVAAISRALGCSLSDLVENAVPELRLHPVALRLAIDADLALRGCPDAGTSSPFAIDPVAFLTRKSAWSQATFGPLQSVAGVLDHIEKEIAEIKADPSDPVEWADLILLAFDGADRAGVSPREMVAALIIKQAKNETRDWPDWRDSDPDKAIEHTRGQGRRS